MNGITSTNYTDYTESESTTSEGGAVTEIRDNEEQLLYRIDGARQVISNFPPSDDLWKRMCRKNMARAYPDDPWELCRKYMKKEGYGHFLGLEW